MAVRGPARPVGAPRAQPRGRSLARLSEVAVVLVFAAVSLAVVVQALWLVLRYGGVWSGTDGVLAQDQLQHLAWVRDIAGHGAASNRFVLEPRPHDYLQPLAAVSALLVKAGVSPALAVLLWKPVAVGACVIAVRAVVRATVDGTWTRVAVLAVALLGMGWGAVATQYLDLDGFAWRAVSDEMSLTAWTHGYPFALVAFAAMVLALLAYADDRDAGRVGWRAPALGLLAGWVHPWQGETLILIVLGAEATLRFVARDRAPVQPVLATTAATALPLAGYAALGRADVSWDLAQQAGHATWPLWVVGLSLLPVALLAAPAYRAVPRDPLRVAVRVWPFAALVVFLLAETPQGSGALHALMGVEVPLAILAGTTLRAGWGPGRRPPPAAAAITAVLVAVLAVPLLEQLRYAHATVSANYTGRSDGMFVSAGEDRALAWLDAAPGGGGVMARARLGALVPERTGRSTYVGNAFWTPRYFERSVATDRLFLRGLTGAADERLIRVAGPRFLLAGCDSPPDLAARLGAVVGDVHAFGCASVLVVARP